MLHDASPLLEDATRRSRRGRVVAPGSVLSVRLPAEDALRQAQGVEYVIHAVGPNMNPQRANCVGGGDYELGCSLLEQTFAALFDQFASILLYAGQPAEL